MYQTERDLQMVEDKVKTQTWGAQLADMLSSKLDTPAGTIKSQIFTDTFTVSQASKQLFPAENQQIQIQLKMDNAIVSCKRSYLFGQMWVQYGGIIPDARQIFELIQLNLGGVTDTLSYNSVYRTAQRCRRGHHPIYDRTACQKIEGFYSEPWTSFDGYSQTNLEPTFYIGTSANTLLATTPYQLYSRQLIANYLANSTGNFITGSDGSQYKLVNFAVSLADLSEILEEQDLIALVLGQQLKMVIRTNPSNMCVQQAFRTADATTNAYPQYGLNNLSLYVQYIELIDQDLDRILQASIEMKIPASIPFTQQSCPSVYNAVHSLSISDRLDSLILYFMPNYQATDKLLDAANISTNLLGPGIGSSIMPIQTCKLNFSVVPPIQLITLQYGSRQITINNQQLPGMMSFLDLDDRAWTGESKLVAGIKNALCIDLRRFFDDEIGSFPGASSSLIVQVNFALGQNNGSANPTQLRTLAYQQQDWSLQALQNLQVFSFARVTRKALLQRGVYQMAP